MPTKAGRRHPPEQLGILRGRPKFARVPRMRRKHLVSTLALSCVAGLALTGCPQEETKPPAAPAASATAAAVASAPAAATAPAAVAPAAAAITPPAPTPNPGDIPAPADV